MIFDWTMTTLVHYFPSWRCHFSISWIYSAVLMMLGLLLQELIHVVFYIILLAFCAMCIRNVVRAMRGCRDWCN
jgi:hypothetical protein